MVTKENFYISGKDLTGLIKAVHEKGLPFRFRAGGFSMAPFVKDGDIITVIPKNTGRICCGDIVAFVHPVTERLVVHRVLSENGKDFIIRGDNTSSGDGPIPASNILGIVSRVERKGKAVSLGLGVEKRLIALLSEKSLLIRLRFLAAPLWKMFRPFSKKMSS